MPEPKHTRLPWVMHWEYDITGYSCYYINGFAGPQKRDEFLHKANMSFIMLACHSHYELVDILQELWDYGVPDSWYELDEGKTDDDENNCLATRIHAALAKAGEEP